MKARPEKNVCRDARMFDNLRSNRLMTSCFRMLRVGAAVILMIAISAGVLKANAEPAALYPPECPDWTTSYPVGITLTVTLQRPNAPAPDPSWAVPVHFSLHPVDQPDIICWEWDLTLDQSGDWSGNLDHIPAQYDARIKNPHTLRNVKRVDTWNGPWTIDMGTLLEGDASDNNFVKGEDFSILRTSYWTQQGQPGFDDRADFDEDDWVKGSDFSLLRTNYWQQGDIVVP